MVDANERETLAGLVKKTEQKFGGPSLAEFATDPPIRKHYAVADAILREFDVTPRNEDMGPAANCHLCVGAGGHDAYDGEWVECACQRQVPQGREIATAGQSQGWANLSPDDEGWARTVSDYRAVGWEGNDPGDHERMFWEAGFRQGVAALRAASETGGAR